MTKPLTKWDVVFWLTLLALAITVILYCWQEDEVAEVQGDCLHQNGVVMKSEPVTIERRVGAVVEVRNKLYCVDCGIEVVVLTDIETEGFTMTGCILIPEPNAEFEIEEPNEVKE